MSDEFKPPEAIPWGAPRTIAESRAEMEAMRENILHGSEGLEDYYRRMNTSDGPEAVAFRERWAKTESGRGEDP